MFYTIYPQQKGLSKNINNKKGSNNIFSINRNIPPTKVNTRTNIARMIEKTKMKGVKTTTISINNSFKPNINNSSAINISMTPLFWC